ncbi:uncharacterized protein LOC117179755 isoform X1 [Belonocnema kinseyi]|uniref:uncharacterized protein LOC117179755 isoform X1 n=1 Tax=Belonocnema kinseyi TaxID=2817044 RepID=UPI00143D3698|nr:uncharacterized protein LOC117179755 isoform X1 [Belonocnema kinseyi]
MKCFITRCDSASNGWNIITKKKEKCEKIPKSPTTCEKALKSFKRDEKIPKSTAQPLPVMPMRYRKRSMFKPPSMKMWRKGIFQSEISKLITFFRMRSFLVENGSFLLENNCPVTNEKMLKVWQRVIPDQSKELKMNHVLCELHFKNEDIERDRVVYKKGGIVEREVRKHPILYEEAVPCYFSKNLRPRLRSRVDEGCAVLFEIPANFSEELMKECDKLAAKKLIKERA